MNNLEDTLEHLIIITERLEEKVDYLYQSLEYTRPEELFFKAVAEGKSKAYTLDVEELKC